MPRGLYSIAPWNVTNRPQGKPVYGLLRLSANLECQGSIEELWIELKIEEHYQRFNITDIARRLTDTVWELSILVNSHLFSNGVARLTVTSGDSAGNAIEFPGGEFWIENEGPLAEAVRADLKAHGSPLFIAGCVDAAMYPFKDGKAKAWFDQPEAQSAAADVPLSTEPATDVQAAIDHLVRWGFAILHETIPPQTVAAFNDAVQAALLSGRLLHRPGSSDRIHDAHRMPEGREIWLFRPVLDFLRQWFRDEPCACQTLLYVNGSEQDAHQDTIHLTPYPSGYMCGVWVALEDVQPDSGELFVYPGSHRTPRLFAGDLGLQKVTNDYSSYFVFSKEIERLLDDGQYQRLVYRPKAGQILVWHENLIHGGSVRRNPNVTRRSIVSHYYARGGVGFYDSRGESAYLEAIK